MCTKEREVERVGKGRMKEVARREGAPGRRISKISSKAQLAPHASVKADISVSQRWSYEDPSTIDISLGHYVTTYLSTLV